MAKKAVALRGQNIPKRKWLINFGEQRWQILKSDI